MKRIWHFLIGKFLLETLYSTRSYPGGEISPITIFLYNSFFGRSYEFFGDIYDVPESIFGTYVLKPWEAGGDLKALVDRFNERASVSQKITFESDRIRKFQARECAPDSGA